MCHCRPVKRQVRPWLGPEGNSTDWALVFGRTRCPTVCDEPSFSLVSLLISKPLKKTSDFFSPGLCLRWHPWWGLAEASAPCLALVSVKGQRNDPIALLPELCSVVEFCSSAFRTHLPLDCLIVPWPNPAACCKHLFAKHKKTAQKLNFFRTGFSSSKFFQCVCDLHLSSHSLNCLQTIVRPFSSWTRSVFYVLSC